MIQKWSYIFAAIALFQHASCTFQQPISKGSAEGTIDQIFAANDSDRNGCLSRNEWRRMVDASLNALGADAPDNISQVERSLMEVFPELDVDRDGCVDREEYLAFAREGARTHQAHSGDTVP